MVFWAGCSLVWPQGLLDAYIAMIPKADGDSTSLRSTTPQCAQVVGLTQAWSSHGVGGRVVVQLGF